MLMLVAGMMHFLNAQFFVRIVPPSLPLHLELVYLSGFCELALAPTCRPSRAACPFLPEADVPSRTVRGNS
jgi:uncharacterized membrane protein